MRTLLLACLCTLALSGCISISTAVPQKATPFFVTETLPATKTPFGGSPTPPPSTATAATLSVTAATDCKDSAVLLQDVTIADGTNVANGAKFTKTWQFKNTGTCPWHGYSIAFASGDRMGAPDSAVVDDTAPKSTVNVSVDLVAPLSDGIYTGVFELHDASGKVLPIGIEKSFWVKIAVGEASMPTLAAVASTAPTAIGTAATPKKGPLSCKYVLSGSYPDEIAGLINNARKSAGLPALNVDARLAAAAQGHSTDMACFSLLSHSGSDGSTIQQRISAAGYPGSYVEEIIYAGGYPQNAFDWWMNDQQHHDIILDTQLTDMGVGYAYVSDSAYGGYYTVDFGGQ